MKRTTAEQFARPEAREVVDQAIETLHVKPDIYGFTPEDAAQILGLSRRKLYYLIQYEQVAVIRHPSRSGNGPGGKMRIPRAALVDYVAERLGEARTVG